MEGLRREPLLARSNGVTLIELLIVVVIIGIVASFALPRIDYTRYRVNSSMRGVSTSLLGAQKRAVSLQHDVIVTFNAATNGIRVIEDANNNGAEDGGERTRGIPLGEQVVLGLGGAPAHPIGAGPITFTKVIGGLPAVTFHRNGAASQRGGVYFTSRRAQLSGGSHATDTRLLEIERSTGRVSWHRWQAGWERGF
jgi:prepilin-type N-terminal cleavage/methylation domain-containing protein